MQSTVVVPAIVGVPYRGAWVPGVLYYLYDVVGYSGKTYRSLQEHVSSTRRIPGTGTLFWREI